LPVLGLATLGEKISQICVRRNNLLVLIDLISYLETLAPE
jgi:hypothetical protein